MAATCGITRSATTPTIRHVQDVFAQLRIGAGAMNANAAVEGRRHASVKSQGAYILRDSSTIPKKLGAKKTGGMSHPPPLLIRVQLPKRGKDHGEPEQARQTDRQTDGHLTNSLLARF